MLASTRIIKARTAASTVLLAGVGGGRTRVSLHAAAAASSPFLDVGGIRRHRRRWMSSSSVAAAPSYNAAPAADAATSTRSTPEEEERLYDTLYMWGTDKKEKGTTVLKPSDRLDESKIDVPTRVSNWRDLLVTEDTTTIKIRKVVCGATDTALLLSDGSCYVFGENGQGQLGLGHKNPVLQPTRVELPVDQRTTDYIRDVALGSSNFAAYVDDAGDLYTCGFGGSAFAGMGMLGHGDGASVVEGGPKLVESLVEDGCRVKKVQVGDSHMTVLTTEGEVLTCGAGSYGRLGNFDTVDQLYLEPVELLTSGIADIAGGKSFTLALSNDGVVYGWGRNHKGQLGTGLGLAVDMYAMQAVPEPIEADELLGRRVVQIAAGSSHAACITKGGELFWWGSSLHLEPVRVNDLLHTQIVDVACGKDYTVAIDKDGKAYSFGKGKTGVLGQGGNVKQANQAALMEAFVADNVRVGKVSAGWDHAAALCVDSAASDEK